MTFNYGGGNSATYSLPPLESPSWQMKVDETDTADEFNRDRFRLGRELARDFEEASFSDVAPPGGEGEDDYTNTVGPPEDSFGDIGQDANATSTKRISPNIFQPAQSVSQNMLRQSPTVDSQQMRDNFVDFTMAAANSQAESENADTYEMGRGGVGGINGGRKDGVVSFLEQDSDFSIGFTESPNAKRKKRAGGMIDDGKRNDTQSAIDIGSRRFRLPPKGVQNTKPLQSYRSLGSPVQRTSSFPSFDFLSPPSATTPRRLVNNESRHLVADGDIPSKIMDFVSTSGSGGSRASKIANFGTNPRHSEEEALSKLGNFSDIRSKMSKPRFSQNASDPIGETTTDRPSALAKTQKTISDSRVPKSFKSTSDFLKELGLDGHTQTINLQTKLKELKDIGLTPRKKPGAAPPPSPPARDFNAEPSFAIPANMTELFTANDATRFSLKIGAAGNSHVPIDSIPIPHETRAVLTAMRLLQEKVSNLENNKHTNEQKCAKLENELKRAEIKYQQETRRARVAEEELRKRGKRDISFRGGDDIGGLDKEQTKKKWRAEKLRMFNPEFLMRLVINVVNAELESTIAILRGDIEQIQNELEMSKGALRSIQDERNIVISSVAMAIASSEDLKATNGNLQDQIDQMQHEKRQAERRTHQQQEEFRIREEQLRQRAKEAHEAAEVAVKTIKEKARRDLEAQQAAEQEAALKRRERRKQERQQIEREARERAEQEREAQRRHNIKTAVNKRVREALYGMRPDLFMNRTEPFTIPLEPTSTPNSRPVVEVQGKKRVIAVPRSRKPKQATGTAGLDLTDCFVTESKGKQTEHVLEHELSTAYDTSKLRVSVSQDKISSFEDGSDSTMSVSSEEIRRIAKEINAERKKRRAAELQRHAEEKQRTREHLSDREAVEKSATKQDDEPATARTAPVAQNIIQPAVQPFVQSVGSDRISAPTIKPNARRIVKVVYMMEEDCTEVQDLEKEIGGEMSSALKNVHIEEKSVSSVPPAQPDRSVNESPSQPEVVMTQSQETQPMVSISQDANRKSDKDEDEQAAAQKPIPRVSQQRPASAPPMRVSFAPVESMLPVKIHPNIDDADHNCNECTVCLRFDEVLRRELEVARENLLDDIDNSCLFPAPDLDPASQRPLEAYEEEPTLRPSANPKTQLKRVVQQLKDEFKHLKL
jgi:hypothetical protein